MTSVNLPRDDAASRIDTKAVAERNVKEAEPYPTVQPVKPHEDVTKAPLPAPRKQIQRRHGERRKQSVPVLLDTRSGHDRRNVARNEDIELEGDSPNSGRSGIDVYT